jgi:hypothetical protein
MLHPYEVILLTSYEFVYGIDLELSCLGKLVECYPLLVYVLS